jgi:1,4-alpha-glucan branching enzyme
MAAYPVERQGFGGIHARKALLKVLHHELERTHPLSPFVNTRNNVISFFIYDHAATKISLVGSFNDWEKDVRLLKPGRNGLWQINIPMLGPGRYYYKFLVNGTEWREDIDNPYREADGLGGWNSVLEVSE